MGAPGNLPGIWSQTSTGRAVDLLEPKPTSIHWPEVAEQLARQARFSGACGAGPYSIAQHSVLGADALFRQTGNREMSAAFLLHDAHEYVLGDITTPVAEALAYSAGRAALESGNLTGVGTQAVGEAVRHAVRQGLAGLKAGMDRAIYTAAGLPWPLPAETQHMVALMDRRMMKTERNHLMAFPPASWGTAIESAEPVRLIGKMRVWPWPEAADAFLEQMQRYLPHLPRQLRTPPARAQKRKLTPA